MLTGFFGDWRTAKWAKNRGPSPGQVAALSRRTGEGAGQREFNRRGAKDAEQMQKSTPHPDPVTRSPPLARPSAGLRLWRIPFVASQATQVLDRGGEGGRTTDGADGAGPSLSRPGGTVTTKSTPTTHTSPPVGGKVPEGRVWGGGLCGSWVKMRKWLGMRHLGTATRFLGSATRFHGWRTRLQGWRTAIHGWRSRFHGTGTRFQDCRTASHGCTMAFQCLRT